MTAAAVPAGRRWSVLLSGRLWAAGAMGFAGGLPLLLTSTVLQAWLTDAGVGLTTVGLLGLVGLPYALKPCWAPLVDRYTPLPLGRRRSWLLLSQVALAGALALLGAQEPRHTVWLVVLASTLVTMCSATQDIVIDAYRRESLADDEQGLGASFYTYGYRLGMLVASAGGLIAADLVGFRNVYFITAAVMLAPVLVTLAVPEPATDVARPATLRAAFIEPLAEFFTRGGRLRARVLWLLVFLVVYKLGDNLALHMSTPFYLGTGFTNTEIGTVAKGFGTGALLIGVFAGGVLVLRAPLFWTLLIVGLLQGVSTVGYAVLTIVGDDVRWLAAVIAFENVTSGMGTSALLALLAALTDRRFTATQFALLSALATAPRAVLVAPGGALASHLGWPLFFLSCGLAALPALVLLVALRTWMPDHPGSAFRV